MAEEKLDRYATPNTYSDLPLLERGFENEPAFFRFNEYSTTFARMLAAKRTRTPMVLGISGKWGSGKTTLLRLIRQKLDSSQHLEKNLSQVAFVGKTEDNGAFRQCRTVWFNAWKYADEDSLLAALIRVILQAMANDEGLKGQLKAWAAEKNQERYDVVATFLSAFSFKFGKVDFGIDIEKYKKEAPFKAHTAFFDHFNLAFQQLLALWVHGSFDEKAIDPQQGILAVFIDDLDRCLPAKTLQVLEAVKLFLDKPGVAFVIGADEDVIRKAVEAHYDNEKIVGEDARDYLEKIFQVRFGLPPLRAAEADAYMKTGLQLPADRQTSIDQVLAGTDTNPRRIKTTLNYLEVNWAILQNANQASDDLREDFFRWLLIELASAGGDFANRVRGIEDRAFRLKFLREAEQWAKSREDAKFAEANAPLLNTLREYEKYTRLVKILRQGQFSAKVTEEVLDQFVYWSALAPVIEQQVIEETGNAKVSFGASGKDVVVTKLELQDSTVELIEIPKGEFLMGSVADNKSARDDEKPQHTVMITRDYWIGRYPVTNAQYKIFAEAQKTGWKTDVPDDHPAVNVSWEEAVAYCRWLNEQVKGQLPDGYEIRLPTEAEWEKAARGPYGNEWPWGNEWDAKKCNSSEGGPGRTTAVGAYSAVGGDSPYGVADMAGNVWEWCLDWYAKDEYKKRAGKEVRDPSGPNKGDYYVLRGGAFDLSQAFARCASRSGGLPVGRSDPLGFRVVAALPVSR